jgi:LacI family transcriptional regulator, gluconate utilization system Gnt-I transcriptional repressor
VSEGASRRQVVRVEDVARVAGVSPITVSRVLSKPDLVRPETRARVQAAIAETGYVINPLASSLRSGRSTFIALFVSNLRDPQYAASVQGCVTAFEGTGFHLLIAETEALWPAGETLLQSMSALKPAALVFVGGLHGPELRERIARLDLPVMEIGDINEEPLDMQVGFASVDGGRMMGRHFAELGFSRPVYAGRTEGRGEERLRGFQEAIAAAGIDAVRVLPLEKRRLLSDGREGLDQVLARYPDCDAVFFSSDILATGALLHAERMTPRPPIGIAGFGDIALSGELLPPLTSIAFGAEAMGMDAGRRLHARLAGNGAGGPVTRVPLMLMARESTLAFRTKR